MLIVGFTGTRDGMRPEQAAAVRTILQRLLAESTSVVFHHGDCVGADVEAHDMLRALDPTHLVTIVVHPARWSPPSRVHDADEVRPALPPLTRNRVIVDSVSLMIAAPVTMHEFLRSGTWATVRYARRTSTRLSLVLPDGSVT